MNPFDYVNQILQGKKNLIVDELTEKEYSSFLTNRSLSYHMDCVMFANEMNVRHFIDKKMQNDFLLNTIRSRKRPFVKWSKSEKSEDIDLLKIHFNMSETKVREILNLISESDIKEIRNRLHTGGLNK